MKILYVGHFLNKSGWSQAALDYLLAMDSVGIDVVARTIKLNDSNPDMPPRFHELSAKSSRGCDIVIQHVLPHHLKYDGFFKKNIALCVYESGGTWYNNWNAKINMMDELWVPSPFTASVFTSGGVTIPINIVPHTCDITKYTKVPTKISHPELDGNFIFYTIADLNIRKNLRAIVQAFHLGFTPNEPVSLIIKSGKFGKSPAEVTQIIADECSKIKTAMKLYRNVSQYKNEFIVANELSQDDILALHHTGDCYVNTSHGEAWCIPAFDAMAMGNKVVFPEKIYSFISSSEGYPFKTHHNSCFGCMDTFWEIGSSREDWLDCDPKDVAAAMRKAYEDKKDKTTRRRNKAKQYSYTNIGNMIKGLL